VRGLRAGMRVGGVKRGEVERKGMKGGHQFEEKKIEPTSVGGRGRPWRLSLKGPFPETQYMKKETPELEGRI